MNNLKRDIDMFESEEPISYTIVRIGSDGESIMHIRFVIEPDDQS